MIGPALFTLVLVGLTPPSQGVLTPYSVDISGENGRYHPKLDKWTERKGMQNPLPGFKSRITLKGLDYADQVAIAQLSKVLGTATVPDQHGDTGAVKYDLTGLKVTGFSPPATTVNLIPGTGLTWVGNGATLSMNGNFHYKLDEIIPIEGSGSFDISITGLSFSIKVAFGVDSGGRPKVAASGCNCDISKVDITFHGGASWLYNIFAGLLEPTVRDSLKGTVCSSVTSLINDDGEKELASLPVTVNIVDMFLLDYRLIQSPNFTKTYLETFHKGEIFWKNDTTEAPFRPTVMGDVSGDEKMMYLWLSDYVFNTMGLVAQQHNVLNYNLTAGDLPADQRGILNTTCTSLECLGNLIPKIGKAYPHSTIELHMLSGSVPKMGITQKDVGVTCSGKIIFYAREKNNSLPYLMTIMADMQASLTLSVVNKTISGKVDDVKLALKVTDSAVGNISSAVLQIIVDQVLKSYLIPTLNKIGQAGFPLPVTDGISLVNSTLTFMQDFVLIGTDVQYKA